MKKVLLCATDAGGVRNIEAMWHALNGRGERPVLITSTLGRSLLHPNVPHSIVEDADDIELESLLDGVLPDAIICGTTRDPSPDRRLISLARRRGIRTVAIVDEGFGFRQRFETVEGRLELPDVVALMDDRALNRAINEGLPADRCAATGSPALARLFESCARSQATDAEPPPCLAEAPSWPVITFLSETFSIDYGAAPGEHGPLGSFLGYTEHSLLEAVDRVLRRCGRPVLLVEKLHPVDPRDADGRLRVMDSFGRICVKHTPLWPLLLSSCGVIAARSMGLVEAVFLGIPAASCQPDRIGPELCTAVRAGLVPLLTDERELQGWCSARLSGVLRARAPLAQRPAFASESAVDRVLMLAVTTQ